MLACGCMLRNHPAVRAVTCMSSKSCRRCDARSVAPCALRRVLLWVETPSLSLRLSVSRSTSCSMTCSTSCSMTCSTSCSIVLMMRRRRTSIESNLAATAKSPRSCASARDRVAPNKSGNRRLATRGWSQLAGYTGVADQALGAALLLGMPSSSVFRPGPCRGYQRCRPRWRWRCRALHHRRRLSGAQEDAPSGQVIDPTHS